MSSELVLQPLLDVLFLTLGELAMAKRTAEQGATISKLVQCARLVLLALEFIE